jgi:Tfp pilus assembly protein PilO
MRFQVATTRWKAEMNKTRQWALLTSLGCVALLVVGWLVIVKPERSHAASLRSQATDVQASNATLQGKLAQLRAEQKDTPAEEKLLASINQKVPDNPQLPTLIRQLSAAADGAGVTLLSLAPGAPVAVAVPAAAATTAGATTTAAAVAPSPLSAIPLAVSVQGTYANIESFFSAVESLSRAMLVSSFTIAPAGAATGAGSAGSPTGTPGQLAASLNTTVFEAPAVGGTAPTTATGH